MEGNGIMIRIGGYKNLDIRWKSESILRAWDDIEYGNIRRRHPKMPYDY